MIALTLSETKAGAELRVVSEKKIKIGGILRLIVEMNIVAVVVSDETTTLSIRIGLKSVTR